MFLCPFADRPALCSHFKLFASIVMNQLADVELQLIMHGLQATELLQLARCSHRLMHAADSAFAWKFASPL
jgi:hypothetical protein